jgi:hypothetical protein
MVFIDYISNASKSNLLKNDAFLKYEINKTEHIQTDSRANKYIVLY